MHTEIEPHAIEVLQNRKDEIEIELIDLYSSFSIRQDVLYDKQAEYIKVQASIVYFMGRCGT